MGKIVISADIHFCKRESLVDNRYPFLLKSFEWLNGIEGDLNVDLGDMFNSAVLTAEDVSILDQIKFSSEWHCIAGNHEIDGSNSLLKYFRDMHYIYERPQVKNFGGDLGWVVFIPYTKTPTPLDVLLSKIPEGKQAVVFSHCEFVGMFGADAGYTVHEIESNNKIKMWFNGHYHTRTKLSPKVQIVGNLLGKNFTQNFDPHGVCIYDTVANTYEFIENPYALTFGKMDLAHESCVAIRNKIEADTEKRYVLAIQCDLDMREVMREWADKYLVASRIVVTGNVVDGRRGEEVLEEVASIDHIAMFISEVKSRFGEEIANAIFKIESK